MCSLLLGTVQIELEVYLQDLLPFFVTFKRKYCDTLVSFCRCELTILMTIQNTIQKFPQPHHLYLYIGDFSPIEQVFSFLRWGLFILAHQGSSLSEWGWYGKYQVHKCPKNSPDFESSYFSGQRKSFGSSLEHLIWSCSKHLGIWCLSNKHTN